MNIGGTTTTAIIRGLYNAIGSGAGSAFLVWTQTNDHKTIAVAFVGAFLIALGFRGGVEGAVDTARQNANDVKPSDVTANP
jgi:sulfite exporter TauE/SafE